MAIWCKDMCFLLFSQRGTTFVTSCLLYRLRNPSEGFYSSWNECVSEGASCNPITVRTAKTPSVLAVLSVIGLKIDFHYTLRVTKMKTAELVSLNVYVLNGRLKILSRSLDCGL